MPNNKKLVIELTEAQEKFLKKFNEDHYDGSDKNLATVTPIHVVESVQYLFVPYDWKLEEYSLGGHICFYETDTCHLYHDINDLTEDWNNNTDEEYNIPNYESVIGEKINSVFIDNEEDYINAYGIENIEVSYAIKKYVPKAFFFIREEAEKYIEYQKHNLCEPRVYTYSPGYANYGEYTHFFELLQNIGKQLNLTENN